MKSQPLLPETNLQLNAEEIEILLVDVHNQLAQALEYIRNLNELTYLSQTWIRRRINVLKNLSGKLETAYLQKDNEKETNEKDEYNTGSTTTGSLEKNRPGDRRGNA
jgi:hypothetical protein